MFGVLRSVRGDGGCLECYGFLEGMAGVWIVYVC